MHILLIGNKETAPDTDSYYGEYAAFFQGALDAASSGAHEISYVLIDELYIQVGDSDFIIHDTKHDKDIASYDAVLIRAKGLRNYFDVVKTISVYARQKALPVINDYSGFRDSSKLAQAVQFFMLDIPVATTIYANRAVLSGTYGLPFTFPCIMKATFGAHGNDNYLVESIEEARNIAAKDPKIQFVLQRFVPNDGDFRILLAGNEVLIIKRLAQGESHLNNTSQGGSASLVDLDTVPTHVITDSRKIAAELGMTIAGVDVLADKNTGEFFFLEVNSQPQLMSGAFVPEKITTVGRYFAALAAERVDTRSSS